MKKRTPAQLALQEAANHAGGQAALARLIGRTPQEVWNWINRDDGAPIEACPFIAEGIEHKVTCERLRPDTDWAAMRRSLSGSEPKQAA